MTDETKQETADDEDVTRETLTDLDTPEPAADAAKGGADGENEPQRFRSMGCQL